MDEKSNEDKSQNSNNKNNNKINNDNIVFFILQKNILKEIYLKNKQNQFKKKKKIK